METIPKTDCQNIGFFRKTHGISGGLVLEFEPHLEFSIEEANRFFVELEGLLVPFFLKENGFRFKSGNTAILNLEWVDTEIYAKRLVGNSVYLFNEEILDEPEETLESQFIGFFLTDTTLGGIGWITDVNDYSGNLVISVDYKGEELLIPYNEELLEEINEDAKTIQLNLPDGILE